VIRESGESGEREVEGEVEGEVVEMESGVGENIF